MSHIPAAAMPHAKPHAPEAKPHKKAPAPSGPNWGVIAAVAGGVLALGAAAAAAVPLLRGRAAPKRERRHRKAHKSAAK